MSGPLRGIRIIDLSSMMSGPWATDILGDQGADVIKVEVPGKGDHVRSLPNRSGGMSAMFVNVNRSKRSMTLDLKSAAGVDSAQAPRRLVLTWWFRTSGLVWWNVSASDTTTWPR